MGNGNGMCNRINCEFLHKRRMNCPNLKLNNIGFPCGCTLNKWNVGEYWRKGVETRRKNFLNKKVTV